MSFTAGREGIVHYSMYSVEVDSNISRDNHYVYNWQDMKQFIYWQLMWLAKLYYKRLKTPLSLQ